MDLSKAFPRSPKQEMAGLVHLPRIIDKGRAYKENKLSNTELSEQALIEKMTQFPKLIERPIVVKGNNAVLGRPPENVLELL